jgi:hypothetical protein
MKNQIGTAENVSLVQSVLEKWVTLKSYLMKGFEEGEIPIDDESHFLEIKSDVTRSIRALSERLGETKLDYGDKIVRDVSVNHVQGLPIADKRQLLKDWHRAFIMMSRTSGALAFLAEGYTPKAPKKTGAKKSADGGGAKKFAIGAVVVAALGAGVWYYLTQM